MRTHRRVPRSLLRSVARAVLASLLIASLFLVPGAWAAPATAAPEAIDWVGNLNPASGSHTAITSGESLTVTVEAYKAGVTDVITGDSSELECHLYWSKVDAFGGAWQATPFDTPMAWAADAGNNDRFTVTVSPMAGLYEFTAYCYDVTDAETTWSDNPNGNIKLTVNAITTGVCGTAALGDNDIYWDPLLHDSFAAAYRNPGGAVNTAQGTVALRFRTCSHDVQTVELRVWDDRNNVETFYPLAADATEIDPVLGEMTLWKADLSIPVEPTIYYYIFRLIDGTRTVFYRDDDTKFYGGGVGTPEDVQSTAELNSYQLTVYDQNFTTPAWMQKGIVYQVFPDRFRDGNTANNPAKGRFYYNQPGGTIWRSFSLDPTVWNTLICDPRASGACQNKFGENFYGGDLPGITQMINAGYFNNLGVSVIYLNPIFTSPSNHKYDTANYRTIDKDFGGSSAFQNLVAAAASKGISVILDGVFNHTSSDSAYFDIYSRWNFNDILTSQNGPGLDDNIQACESVNSARRPWYFIPDAGSPATGPLDRCDPIDTDDRGGAWTQTYTAWYGYGSLPKLNSANQGVRNLFYASGMTSPNPSIGPYWVQQGADGWRLDVGGDVDPGLTNESPTAPNTFWEGFRTQVKDPTVQTRTVPAIIGEEWGDASPWLLGSEWDSAMNYRLRSAALNWLFTGCSGDGCTGGTTFEDNDSNAGSSSGAISAITPSQLDARLRSIHEDYPPVAFKAMMNIGDSHDTNRLRFLLKKINNNDDTAALKRLQEYWLFNMTYAGAPTIYYGDEMAVQADGVFANGKWEDDPYNRAPFPWNDTPGSYTPYTGMLPFLRALTSARQGYAPLQDGDVQHGLVVSDMEKVYAFARTIDTAGAQKSAFIVLNRDTQPHTVVLEDLGLAPYNSFDGETFRDVITRNTYTVACDDPLSVPPAGCRLSVEVPSESGLVLTVPGKADQPEQPLLFAGIMTTIVDLNLNWGAVIRDVGHLYEFPNRYELWTSTTPYGMTGINGNMTLLAELQPADFGGSRSEYIATNVIGDPAVNHFYKVVAENGAGGRSLDSREMAEFDFALVPGS